MTLHCPGLSAPNIAARDADDFVHDNPYAALAVIGLLGLAAGYLLARR
jgi:ElaB/YqjD/DUF883 family membrane-anchored ribosome-binding protein